MIGNFSEGILSFWDSLPLHPTTWDFVSWYFLYFAEWAVRIVMLFVLVVNPRRRKPSSTMAWLLVIFFQPWFGLVLYMLIGRTRLPNDRWQQHAFVNEQIKELSKAFKQTPGLVHEELPDEFRDVVTLAEQLGNMPILGGNQAELICDTDEAISRLIVDIDQATAHVHLLFYMFADDQTGRKVVEALRRAVERGVECRVLMDAVASRPTLKSLAHQMRDAGIEVYAVLPVRFIRGRADIRNHRKVAVIDGHTGYTGSQNIVDADYGHKDLAWHDMMIRLSGPVVLQLQAVFASDWFFESKQKLSSENYFPEPIVTGDTAVQTLPSGPSFPTENYQYMVVNALYGANSRVTITTPYFVPDEPFLQAIQTAVLRGVKVEIVVPNRSDQVLVGAASRSYYDSLLEAGVDLYLYQPGLLHSKTMSIDDSLALIGSSNFDIRSFAINFEINLLFYDADVTRRLRIEQHQYISDSILLTAKDWRNRSALQRMAQNVAKLLSPLL
ncbi:MAG: cardiolipin synthase [Pirellulales bacterium]|nr:cardiolipin synthase [Pirellulales bacterium]